MNMKQASLGILGLGIGMGAVLSLAPISAVQAASLGLNIFDDQDDIVGNMSLEWEDSSVDAYNRLIGFESLTDFRLTNYRGMDYDYEFVTKTQDLPTTTSFTLDLNTGMLGAEFSQWAIDPSTNRPREYGFSIYSDDYVDIPAVGDLNLATIVLNSSNGESLEDMLAAKTFAIDFDLGANDQSTDSLGFAGSERTFFNNVRVASEENDATPQSVPENSLTTALLVIAGLIFLNPHKLF
ncbi:MAG: hypothetical protein AB4060_18145 [Crocosphaera sp.]